MHRLHILTLVTAGLIIIGAVFGCSDSDDPTAPVVFPDGSALLGANHDHQLRYVIYDSILTVLPDSQIIVKDTSYLDIGITGGQNETVVMSVNGEDHDLFTIAGAGVLHSGQIRTDIIPRDTLFYYPTPMILPRQFRDEPWQIFTPAYVADSAQIKRSLLFLNYGYLTEREYVEPVEVILPTGSYNAYYYQSLIYDDEMAVLPVMTADEYYAPDVGLVKLVLHIGDHSQRLIILLEDET